MVWNTITDRIRYIKTNFNKKKEDYINDLKRGYKLRQGYTCINTATNNYGKEHQISSNIDFAKNPFKYGFSEVNYKDKKPGDLIQIYKQVEHEYDDNGIIPTHAMIFEGYDEDNIPLFNYSNGGNKPTDYKKARRYPDNDLKDAKAFRFIGNDQDIKNWTEEYYNTHSLGGPIVQAANVFRRGGKKTKESTTPEWAKPTSEYHVTEEPTYEGGMLPDVDITAKEMPEWRKKWRRTMRTPVRVPAAYPNPSSIATWQYNPNNTVDSTVGKELAVTGALLGSVPALGIGSELWAVPQVKRAVDVLGTADAVRNSLSDNGIKKTIGLVQEGNYGKAALSGLGDAFDLLGVADAGRMIYNLGNKGYRAYHAYNTITPYGYDHPFSRGKDFLKSMLLETKYDKPAWYGKGLFREDSSGQERILDEIRDDAWRLYTGQGQAHDSYIKNSDGTYSYNFEKVMRAYMDPSDLRRGLDATEALRRDLIGYTHGGLWKADNLKTGSITTTDNTYNYGKLTIEDLWDLQPFQAKDNQLISGRLADVVYHNGHPVLANTLKNSHLVKTIDNKIANFEAGKLLGGEPFYMKTTIPYTKIDIHNSNPYFPTQSFNSAYIGEILPGEIINEFKLYDGAPDAIDVSKILSIEGNTPISKFINKRYGGPIVQIANTQYYE